MKRNLIGVAAALSLLIPAGVATASPAGAAGAQGCKTLTANAVISPGLTFTNKPQSLTAAGVLGGCTPAATTGGGGTLNAAVKFNGGCAQLAKGGQKLTGTGSTTWKNKKTSKYSIVVTTGTGKNLALATITGKITSGLFAGKNITLTVKFRFTEKPTPDCSPAHPIRKVAVQLAKPFTVS